MGDAVALGGPLETGVRAGQAAAGPEHSVRVERVTGGGRWATPELQGY